MSSAVAPLVEGFANIGADRTFGGGADGYAELYQSLGARIESPAVSLLGRRGEGYVAVSVTEALDAGLLVEAHPGESVGLGGAEESS